MAIQRSSKFPNDPVLVRLLESARLSPHQDDQIVHDEYGFDKTYAELLADIVQTRDALRAQLPPSALNVHGLLHEDRPYICALTRGGYEFMVAFFAIRALGGACMPLGEPQRLRSRDMIIHQLTPRSIRIASGLLVEEAEHFISLAKATALLASASHIEHANKTHAFAAQQGSSDFITLCVSSDATPLSDVDIGINESPELAPDGPGLVLFTSGTTGIPKAAVLPRQCLVTQQAPSPGGCVLNYRPPHWRGGLAATILPPLTGMKLWALKQQPSAEDVWEALKSRTITNLIFNPTMLRHMKETYEQKIESLPPDEKAKYLDGFHKIGKIKCNGATIAPTILKFWTDLTGLPFQNGWGSTECGGGITETILHLPFKHKHAVGPLVSDPPVDVKLSEGDHGEFLLKSPWMLIKYLGDEAATQKAFDEQGYLKTGDLGRLFDGEYIFEGRANTDFIERMPRIPLEDALTSFPYVAEVYVLAVPGNEVREYCAALIRPKRGVDVGEVTLARLHADLADAELPTYMRPYMLRVLDEGEEVPHTLSQKPIWREIVKKFFVSEGRWDGEAPLPGVEIWSSPLGLTYRNDPTQPMSNADAKPWDWGGFQMSN